MMAWSSPPHKDATRQVLHRLGDRWTLPVIETLARQTRRFSQIEHQLAGISQKMLAQTLHRLERDGLVSRTAWAGLPPHVEYTLTEAGHSLHAALRPVYDWVNGRLNQSG